MSGYTIGEIVVWLILAAALGFVLGWLLRELRCRAQHGATASKQAAAPTQAGAVSETAVEPAGFVNSAKPLAGGEAPTADYVIKGNRDSMLYHSPESRSYGQTVAEVWFKTEADAVAAGFRKPGTSSDAAHAQGSPAKAAPTSNAAAKKTPAKSAPAKRAPASKTAAKRAPGSTTAVTKTTARKTAAVPAAASAPAKRAPAKKAPAKQTAAKKAPAKKAPAKNTAAKKSAAKKTPAKKAAPITPGRFPGSARPLSGGRAPSAAYTIKGNEDSMIYHSPESPSYAQTIAETWFKSEADAIAAGFRKPRNM